MISFRFLFAVDPSLTCSGWALFDIASGEVLSVGKIRGEGAHIPLSTRLLSFHRRIEDLFAQISLGSKDLVVCEAPTTMKDPHNAIKVEQVRGIFESSARGRGATVPGRINPRSVQFEVMGLAGKQARRDDVKAAAVKTAQFLYRDNLLKIGFDLESPAVSKHQDIVDAVLIGRLAVLRVQAAQQSGVSLEQLFQGDRSSGSRRSWRVKSCAV
jgi:Holliday junction resolvasome RuvABC endonuclease subunit